MLLFAVKVANACFTIKCVYCTNTTGSWIFFYPGFQGLFGADLKGFIFIYAAFDRNEKSFVCVCVHQDTSPY